MSTIRVKRSTSGTAPTGLTFGEPAFVDGTNSLYVAKNDGTSLRVGAEITTGVTLGTSDNKIPTQNAVKTYIDNNIAGGSVSSVNGLTGAVTIYGGSGISVAAASGGITLTNTGVQSLNGVTGAVTNVARINEGNTYSVKQVMNAGITASTLNVAGVAAFNANTGDISLLGTNTYLNSTTTTVQNATALFSVTPTAVGAANGTLRLKGYDGDTTAYNNDIKPQNTQTGNLVHTLPATTGTLLNSAVTSAVAGTGISVSGSTGAVTFTNTGVQSAVAGNQITVSGATGAVTIGVTSNPSFTSITTTNNGTIGGDLTVTGNLTINGTTTTVNSNTMTIDDPLITLGTSGGLPISASDSGKDRGIVFNYYDNAGRTGFFGWDASAIEFVFQKNSTVSNESVAGVSYGNVHVANLLLQNGAVTADTVIGSAAGNKTHQFRDFDGTIVTVNGEPTTGYILKGNSTAAHTWQNPNAAGFTAFAATSLATARTFSLTGNVTATGITFDGTGNVTLSTTIANDSVALGTQTTGNYAQDVSVAGIGLTISGAAGEGTQYIITSGATSANTASQIVARNASGNFSAGTITASLTGNVTGNVTGSADTLTTSRSIGLTGDISGSANFNGSADINITATIAAGTILNADINASAGIVDTKLATISTDNKVSLSALDIDGGTVTTSITGIDLLIVDNGANGTNRKVTVNNLFGSSSTAVVDGGTY